MKKEKVLKKIDIAYMFFEAMLIIGIIVIAIYILQVALQRSKDQEIRRIAAPVEVTINQPKKEAEPEHVFIAGRNFWQLQSINPDIRAWIEVPGFNIDYPVLAATEEEGLDYYIRRNHKKEKDQHGALYIQTGMDYELNDMVTVIYGHHMKDGSMFGSLYKLEGYKGEMSAPVMHLYYPDKTVTAELLACYTTDAQDVYDKFNDFSSAQDRMNYIYTFKNKTALCDIMEQSIVNGKEKLITLSTCAEGGKYRQLAQYIVTNIEK